MLSDDLTAMAAAWLPAGTAVAAARLRESYVRSTEISHWELEYSAAVDVPTRIVAKLSKNHAASIMREAEFYAKVKGLPCSEYLPRLLGCKELDDGAVLVLEDMSPGFRPPVSAPSTVARLQDSEAIFDALRSFHCCLWEHPDIASFQVEMLASRLSRMIEKERERIEGNLASRAEFAAAVPLVKTVIEKLPGLLRAALSRGRALTFIHGDAHPGNFLVQREEAVLVRALAIDWPNWQPGTPTDDLAYYLTLCLPSQERRAQENTLLRHYHDGMPADLRALYTWEQLRRDYAASILRSMAVAMLWIACDTPQQWAWNSMDHVLAAHEDWPLE